MLKFGIYRSKSALRRTRTVANNLIVKALRHYHGFYFRGNRTVRFGADLNFEIRTCRGTVMGGADFSFDKRAMVRGTSFCFRQSGDAVRRGFIT